MKATLYGKHSIPEPESEQPLRLPRSARATGNNEKPLPTAQPSPGIAPGAKNPNKIVRDKSAAGAKQATTLKPHPMERDEAKTHVSTF